MPAGGVGQYPIWLGPGTWNDTIGLTSYAANAQVFAQTVAGPALNSPPNGNVGQITDIQGDQRIANIVDGLSNTIIFTERYARCGLNSDGAAKGNMWDWWSTTQALPGFEMNYPGTNLNEPYGQLIKFQPQPSPWQTACDWQLASSPHPGVILGCLADGSVRTISQGIQPIIWWSALTPSGGEVLPGDW